MFLSEIDTNNPVTNTCIAAAIPFSWQKSMVDRCFLFDIILVNLADGFDALDILLTLCILRCQGTVIVARISQTYPVGRPKIQTVC